MLIRHSDSICNDDVGFTSVKNGSSLVMTKLKINDTVVFLVSYWYTEAICCFYPIKFLILDGISA